MRLALILLIAACTKEPRPTPPIENRADAGGGVMPSDATADPCVADCIAKNQMRATSPEQIERECRAQCAGGAPP